jgi:hypothetical protein
LKLLQTPDLMIVHPVERCQRDLGTVECLQYGVAFGGLGFYLVQQQLLPYKRACEVMQDLLGPPLTVGTLAALVKCCASR